MRIMFAWNQPISLVVALLLLAGCRQPHTSPSPPSLLGGVHDDREYPNELQKRWALATTAVLTESNGGDHTLLGGCERTPENAEKWAGILKEWWDVESRDDLFRSLSWLDNGGRRADYNLQVWFLSGMDAKHIELLRATETDSEAINRIDVVQKYSKQLGEAGIDAWDHSRYISLCGWGYIAGYLDEDESWQRIMPRARLLQNGFTSWKALGWSHVIGREFWSKKHTELRGELTRKSYQKLLKPRSSPWNQIDWDLNLEPAQPPR